MVPASNLTTLTLSLTRSLLPPAVQVIILVTGRVYLLLECDEQFSRMALTGLLDGMGSSPHGQQNAATTFACLALTMATMAGCNACSSSAHQGGESEGLGPGLWTYEQVVDLLTRTYHNPFSKAGHALMHCSGKSPVQCRGALAAALDILARGELPAL